MKPFAKITHEALALAVTDLLHTFGFEKVARFRPGMDRQGRWKTAVGADGEGYPDLTAVKPAEVPPWERTMFNGPAWGEAPGRIIVAELKIGDDELRDKQIEWLDLFASTGVVETYVWTDKDYLDGTIEAAIRAEGGGKQYRPKLEGHRPSGATNT